MTTRLTPRELELIRGIVSTYNNQSLVRTQMGITKHCAKAHLTHIYDKLGVDNIVGAVVRAYELGIVPQVPVEIPVEIGQKLEELRDLLDAAVPRKGGNGVS